jgi:uncharacterized protein (DUF885 family)
MQAVAVVSFLLWSSLAIAQTDKEKLTSADPAASPLTEAFRRFPATITAEEQTGLAREAAAALDGGLFPAFRKLRRYLTETYIPRARNTIARTAQPQGEAWYAADVRQHTSTLTPQQIHEIGLAEVRRVALPGAEILDEIAGIVGPAGYFRACAELAQVGVNAGAKQSNLIRTE